MSLLGECVRTNTDMSVVPDTNKTEKYVVKYASKEENQSYSMQKVFSKINQVPDPSLNFIFSKACLEYLRIRD